MESQQISILAKVKGEGFQMKEIHPQVLKNGGVTLTPLVKNIQ